MAESAITSATVTLGAEALGSLDNWLKGKRTAMAWFGKDYRTFTNVRPWKVNFSRITFWPYKITKVFTIHRDDWRLVLSDCLSKCQSWESDSLRRHQGECCWLLIYKSIRNFEDAKRLLVKKGSAGSFISAVSTLPAARVESWGLIVLAYANGARMVHRERTPIGSFRIVLPSRDFITTFIREGATGEIVAHIEPRHRAIERYKPLNPDAWYNLLENGYSYPENDSHFEWTCEEVPSELLRGCLDKQLSGTVIDNVKAEAFRSGCRKHILQCYDDWCNIDPGGDDVFLAKKRDYMIDLYEIKAVVLDGREYSPVRNLVYHDMEHVATRQFRFFNDRPANGIDLTAVQESYNRVYAFLKLLFACECVPLELSTRNTGTYISLA